MREIDHWLSEVAACLPRRVARADVIAELRSSVLDRAEEIAGGPVTEESLRAALSAMGEPAEVAMAFTGARTLVDPRLYPSFVTYTGIVFAIHLVMIVAATAFGASIAVFPFEARELPGRGAVFPLLVAAVQALLFDIGLMVVLFAVVTRARPALRLPRLSFPVRTGLRHCGGRATLAVVAFLAFNVFRDRVFVVWTEAGPHSLLTGSFLAALPVVNGLLGLLLLREALYAVFRERRFVLAVDGIVSLAGTAVMIWLIARPSLLAIPSEVTSVAETLPTVNHLVGGAFRMILVLFAAAFAVEALKRFFRLLRTVPSHDRPSA
jgi:hypothetical protein